MNDKIHIMQDTFKNGSTGAEVPGITIIVDGKLRQMFDILLSRSKESSNYVEIVHEILVAGVNSLLTGGQK